MPFHPVGIPVRFTVPEAPDVPAPKTAAVCDRELVGREVEVYNPRLNTSIMVEASGRMSCSAIPETGTQMHLNTGDARRLLGGVEPLGIHEVYVVPVVSG